MKNKNQMYDDIHKIANLLSEIRRNVSSMQCDIQFIYRIIQNDHEEKKYPFASAPLFTTAKDSKILQILNILKQTISIKKYPVLGPDIVIMEAKGYLSKNSDEYKLLKEWLDNDK